MITLFPKDEVFYTLFEKQAEKLTQAIKLLDKALKNPEDLEKISLQMKKLEEEADSLGHEIINHLSRTLITPLESEDIDLLRQKLDDIMDFIEKAVNRMVIYKIPKPFPKEIDQYVEILKEAVLEIKEGIKEIRKVNKFYSKLHHRCQRLNYLEDQGDIVNRTALKNLMNVENITPEKLLEVMKLKEIYETFENAIDSCEDVGNILETILIKNR